MIDSRHHHRPTTLNQSLIAGDSQILRLRFNEPPKGDDFRPCYIGLSGSDSGFELGPYISRYMRNSTEP